MKLLLYIAGSIALYIATVIAFDALSGVLVAGILALILSFTWDHITY